MYSAVIEHLLVRLVKICDFWQLIDAITSICVHVYICRFCSTIDVL